MIFRKEILSVTNKTDGTYYTPAQSPDGFDQIGWELIGHGGTGTVTLKLFATMEEDVTPLLATTATTYVDVTLDTFGVASYVCGAGVTTRHLVQDELKKLCNFKWLRWQYICATGGANDADLTIKQAFRVGA
jgi:hypothetical protein